MFDEKTKNELVGLANQLLDGLREDKSRETIGALAVRLAAMICNSPQPRLRTVSEKRASPSHYTVLDAHQLRTAIDEVLREAIDPLSNPAFDIEIALPELVL